MAYGYFGDLKDFISCASSSFGERISLNRRSTGGYQLSPVEKGVWDEDAKILASTLSLLPQHLQNNIGIICEYDIPGHLGRCDIIFLGADENNKKALIVEMKSWVNFEKSDLRNHVKINGENSLHPSCQVIQYCNRVKYFHQLSNQYKYGKTVLMSKMNGLNVKQLQDISELGVNIFSLVDQSDDLIDRLKKFFSGKNEKRHISEFVNGKCVPHASFAENLLQKLPGITAGINSAISNKRALDLSEKQEQITISIENAIDSNKKVLILIYGSPGSGKTIVGLHSIVHRLAKTIDIKNQISKRAVLALRNNRLCTVVRSAIDDASKSGFGKSVVQYIKGGAQGVGLYYEVLEWLKGHSKSDTPLYDLVIIDEAHRIPAEPNSKISQLDSVLLAGRAVVCLLDEGQALNPDDNGSIANIKLTWQKLFNNTDIFEYKLDEQYRLPFSYSNWVDDFLSEKFYVYDDEYELIIANDEYEVINFLQQKASNDFSCGLLASYTKCNGRDGNDLRIPNLNVRWLMDVKDYNEWWRNKNVRHKFDRCSSVYGCQGFELDYAGLFWGSDLCFTIDNSAKISFNICDNNDITDDIGQAYGKKMKIRAREAILSHDVLSINAVIDDLKNRYRILLTRAKKGIIIYCENPNVRRQLKKCIPH